MTNLQIAVSDDLLVILYILFINLHLTQDNPYYVSIQLHLIVKCFSSGLSIVFLRFILTGYAANQPMMNLSQRNMPFIGISLVYELKKTYINTC